MFKASTLSLSLLQGTGKGKGIVQLTVLVGSSFPMVSRGVKGLNPPGSDLSLALLSPLDLPFLFEVLALL